MDLEKDGKSIDWVSIVLVTLVFVAVWGTILLIIKRENNPSDVASSTPKIECGNYDDDSDIVGHSTRVYEDKSKHIDRVEMSCTDGPTTCYVAQTSGGGGISINCTY